MRKLSPCCKGVEYLSTASFVWSLPRYRFQYFSIYRQATPDVAQLKLMAIWFQFIRDYCRLVCGKLNIVHRNLLFEKPRHWSRASPGMCLVQLWLLNADMNFQENIQKPQLWLTTSTRKAWLLQCQNIMPNFSIISNALKQKEKLFKTSLTSRQINLLSFLFKMITYVP